LSFASVFPLRALLVGAVTCLAVASAAAQPSLPWSPTPYERHALQLLADEAGLQLPLSHWPLPRRAVVEAIDHLPGSLPAPLQAARDTVAAGLERARRGSATLTVRNTDEALAGFGEDGTPGSHATLRSPAVEGPWLAAQLGVRAGRATAPWDNGTEWRLDGSALVAEAGGWQLQAWSRQAWWGPGWQSSLVLSQNTAPMTGIGLQRGSAARSESPWLSWAGPWNFEFFIAQTDAAHRPADPVLIGSRLTLKPLPGLEIGLTRMVQWGGEGRDQSLRSLLRVLAGRGTNNGDMSFSGSDPGNALAGFDLRANCPTGWRCAGYVQAMGEDEADYLPSKYLALWGLEGWSADGRHRWFGEYAETGCRMPVGQPGEKGCAYRNYAYADGYTHGGRWLGAAAGPDSRLLTLGWLNAERRSSLRLHAGRIGQRMGDLGSPRDARANGRLVGLAASTEWQWGPATVTPELSWLRVNADGGRQTQARIGATVTVPLDKLLAL